MSVIKGQNLRVFVDGTVVAEATSCTITLSGQTESSTTKDNAVGDFEQNEIVGRSWTVSVDSFDEGSITTLIGTIIAKTVCVVKFDQAGGTSNATAQSANFSRSGNALLTDLTITAANRQNTTITAQFTGKGKLQ